MAEQKQIYQTEATRYDELISREDHQGNISRALDEIVSAGGLDVLDLGAGTGRLSTLLAPRARTLRALDISHHMLTVTRDKLGRMARTGLAVAVADHRRLPVASASVDLVVSGWSVSYLAVWYRETWQAELESWLHESRRVLRRGGHIVLFESLGTGNESPLRLEHLADFYPWLEQTGFESQWIRTDYEFDSLDEAVERSSFFFGEELGQRVRDEHLVILPECTGVYWIKNG